jgi:solute carrier family 50 protein (sugar transporter)
MPDMILPPIVSEHIAPIIGICLTAVLFWSPMLSLRKAKAAGTLGPVNPLPYCMMLWNCVGWMLYSFQMEKGGGYLFIADCTGLAGLYYIPLCYRLATPAVCRKMELLFVGCGLVLGGLGGVVHYSNVDPKLVLGTYASVVNYLLYLSPLSVIVNVIRTRNAAQFDPPYVCASIVVCAAWAMYGAVLGDWNIGGPNGLHHTQNVFPHTLIIKERWRRYVYNSQPHNNLSIVSTLLII